MRLRSGTVNSIALNASSRPTIALTSTKKPVASVLGATACLSRVMSSSAPATVRRPAASVVSSAAPSRAGRARS